MKKSTLRFFYAFLLMLFCFSTLEAQVIDFPDSNLKAALLNHSPNIDKNYDGEITIEEANTFKWDIVVSNKGIVDMTGIEHFTEAFDIFAESNDIIKFPNPTKESYVFSIYLDNNQLTKIDVSNYVNLVDLRLSKNKLEYINLANGYSNRIYLFARGNPGVCIQHDDVSDVDELITNADVDDTATFNTYCTPPEDPTPTDEDSIPGSCTEEVFIPDANFKAALVAHGKSITGDGASIIDTNGDGVICVDEAEAYSGGIGVSDENISDLTGIEAFPNITELYCSENNLTEVDLSNNTKLKWLFIWDNDLTSLDVSHMSDLTDLFCSSNKIEMMDLSQNLKLRYIRAYSNNMKILKLNNGYNKYFRDVDLIDNPNLCTQVDDNFIPKTANDWTKDKTATWTWNAETCEPLDPSLVCQEEVYIPDDNFRQALIAQNYYRIDTNKDGVICVDEAEAFSGAIYADEKDISDLTGIEAFPNITHLYCYKNNLTELDLSNNTKLRYLDISYNNLTSLEVSHMSDLVYLKGKNNNIEVMDLSQNQKLRELWLSSNSMKILKLNNGYNAHFEYVEVEFNPDLCVQLDLGFSPSPNSYDWVKDQTATWTWNAETCEPIGDMTCTEEVFIPDANFKVALLDHGYGVTSIGNYSIEHIDTNGDGVICVDEAEAYSGIIDVSGRNISDLTGIEAFPNITKLYCSNNNLTEVDLSNNTNIDRLFVEYNNLKSLDVSHMSYLNYLSCKYNNIEMLDLSQNKNFTRKLYAKGNGMKILKLNNGINSILNQVSVNENPDLCIQVDYDFSPFGLDSWTKDETATWSKVSCNSPKGSIVGYVIEDVAEGGNDALIDGDNIPYTKGATIFAYNEFNEIVGSATPNSKGVFHLVLPVGTYTLREVVDNDDYILIESSEPIPPNGIVTTVTREISNVSTTDEVLVFATDEESYDYVVANIDSVPYYVNGLKETFPVELIKFSLTAVGNDIEIKWSTLTELNNDNFEVQRSLDGETFETIATIEGQGTTSKQTDYVYLDQTLYADAAYYRIKQNDYDGQYEIFEVKFVRKTKVASGIKVYPNPTRGLLNIDLSYDDCQLEFINTIGNVVYKVNYSPDVNISNLEKGVYILKITDKGKIVSYQKVTKVD